MANKYPVQVRMREMSKQEEILAKRKREIEKRMKEEEKKEEEGVMMEAATKIKKISSVSSSVSSTITNKSLLLVPPLTPSAPPRASSASALPPASTRVRCSSNIPNKFSNDGSFMEQFKKLTKMEMTDVKEEKAVLPDKARGTKPTPTPTPPVPPSKKKTLSPPTTTTTPMTTTTAAVLPKPTPTFLPDNSILQQVKMENDLEKEQQQQQQQQDEPDWFQDALKRAQAKAKQLLQTTTTTTGGGGVSLSAAPPRPPPSTATSTATTTTEGDCSSVIVMDGDDGDGDGDGGDGDEPCCKKRRSRWAHKTHTTTKQQHQQQQQQPPTPKATSGGGGPLCLNVPANLMGMVGEGEHMQAIQGVMVTRLTRNNPVIISYAHKVFGSLDLTEAQWKQCEEQMKMNVVYQLLQAKKQESERLERQGKVRYEYDSDEDVEGGTWEHKRRAMEMQETQAKAVELTNSAEGKHHIGDFLPPDELARFMEKYRAIKEGRDPDLSDYQDHKLTEENVGYRMLKSMGWTEGMGLGAEGKGITTPVNQNGRSESQGLGVDRPDSLAEQDDEYDAYRKRMMLAYRFRPNPLNNPRRAYY